MSISTAVGVKRHLDEVGTTRERLVTGALPHLIMVAVLGVLYSRVLAPEAGLNGQDALVSAAWFAAGLSATLFVHELAHALTATAMGHPVRTVHLDYLGGHVEFPSDISGRALLAAILAGPAVNLAAGASLAAGWWSAGAALSTPVELAWAAVAAVNLLNGAFNLLPAPDLDGEVAIDAALRCAGASAGTHTVIALLAGLATAGALFAVAVVGSASLPVVVSAACGLYGVYVLHTSVQRARGRG